MTDRYDRTAIRRTRARLEQARNAGAWMPWVGVALAVILWASAGAWLYSFVGVEALKAYPPPVLASGAMLIFTPGVVLICAGLMARESLRSSEANAIVLTAARSLLDPAGQAEEDIRVLAEAVVRETQAVNKTLSDARAKVDGLKMDVETSVGQALKAAETLRGDSNSVLEKLRIEREGLIQISESIQLQSDTLAKAIPRQAQMMAEAARTAQDSVMRADESLNQRLRTLDDTSRRLADRIDALDTMGAESRKRAQTLASALMRLDEQLLQSTRMVDSAIKAGEMATLASRNTADSLRDAVSDALGAAMKASETITERSASAAQEARAAMDQIRTASVQAEAATRAAAVAAQSETEETEKRINRLADVLVGATAHATKVAETGLERARLQIAKASVLFDRMQEDETSTSSVDDLYGASLPGARAAVQPPAPAQPVSNGAHLSWRDLLTGGEATANVSGDGGGEAIIVQRLERGGVRLTGIGPGELRRIAAAARQGADARRRTTGDVAPAEVLRVTRLLDSDVVMQQQAKLFVASNETRALQDLADLEEAGDAAPTRLSAYLLLETAINGAAA
jgi:hypothetical protein